MTKMHRKVVYKAENKQNNVKDPHNYLYSAAEPHLKICCSMNLPEAKILVKNVCSERIFIQRFKEV